MSMVTKLMNGIDAKIKNIEEQSGNSKQFFIDCVKDA